MTAGRGSDANVGGGPWGSSRLTWSGLPGSEATASYRSWDDVPSSGLFKIVVANRGNESRDGVGRRDDARLQAVLTRGIGRHRPDTGDVQQLQHARILPQHCHEV